MAKELVDHAADINEGKIDLSTNTAKELVEEITALNAEFVVRTTKYFEKGNKSAARDARKVSSAIDKLNKAFRKATV